MIELESGHGHYIFRGVQEPAVEPNMRRIEAFIESTAFGRPIRAPYFTIGEYDSRWALGLTIASSAAAFPV
jgi:hypothetical protein